VSAHPHPEHAETAFFIEKRDPFNDAGDFLHQGGAFSSGGGSGHTKYDSTWEPNFRSFLLKLVYVQFIESLRR
jgi:hypothetical protein